MRYNNIAAEWAQLFHVDRIRTMFSEFVFVSKKQDGDHDNIGYND